MVTITYSQKPEIIPTLISSAENELVTVTNTNTETIRKRLHRLWHYGYIIANDWRGGVVIKKRCDQQGA